MTQQIVVKDESTTTYNGMTVDKCISEFRDAYRFKSPILERQREDVLFALGQQWDKEKAEKLKKLGVEPVTDNRIKPNIMLLTGLERQNRSEFKAFPEGEEDTIKAEIATALFKNSMKVSDYQYKASEAFKDGVTCGESYLELYLDNTNSLINAKPCWKKVDSECVFPEPGFKEYDFSDAKYVYKFSKGICKEDLIGMYPEKQMEIEAIESSELSLDSELSSGETHLQKKDYGKESNSFSDTKKKGFDLIERYYKKWVMVAYVGDLETGEVQKSDSIEKAESFVNDHVQQIQQARESFIRQEQINLALDPLYQGNQEPNFGNENKYKIFKKYEPEIWVYAVTPGLREPLADEKAWFFPKWKGWPIIPFYADFVSIPLKGEESKLLFQGIVNGVKGSQKIHNSSETLMMMHLNGAANSGWLSEEKTWTDPEMVKEFGSSPNVNLTYKEGKPAPQRIFPMPLSSAHDNLSQRSAEAIKAELGINADLLAVQEGGSQSGRAIALRQRQGLLMVQLMFDNLARTKQICGRFQLTQLGEIYDTETAKKVLGDSFLTKNFPPVMEMIFDEATGQTTEQPITDMNTGEPMKYDTEMAELAIAEVLKGDLAQYDVAIGEAVASETMKLANAAELQELANKMPGLIPPDLLVEESQLSNSTKGRILSAIKNAQAAAVPTPAGQPPLNMAI